MKPIKMIIAAIAVLFCLTTTASFAKPALSNLHAEKQSQTAKKTLKAAIHHATEIDVVNNSSQMITVKVPGTSIYDSIGPGEVEELWSDVYFDEVEVVLYDEDGYEFFREFVGNHSTIYVNNLLAAGGATKAKTKVSATVKK